MNSGSFFSLDLETSKVVNGITYFNYTDVPDLNVGEDELRFPIRLSITSDSVIFFVHYFVNQNRTYIPHHIEETILKLPFGADSSEALSSSLKHIYNTCFPFSNYLNDLINDRYQDQNTKYENIRKSQINMDSFSSLTIWGLLNKQKDGTGRIEIKDENERITKFLRKLLLDFMFDLIHSDVFETSKYYSEMRKGLMDDFFFSSIVKKSEYYYNRRLVRNRCDFIFYSSDNITRKNVVGITNQLRDNVGNESIKKIYAKYLEESEINWIDTIMTPLADKHFSFSPEWYEDKEKSKKKEGVFRISESWFVNPEEEMERVLFPLKDEKDKDRIHFLNSYELCNLIGTKDSSSIRARYTRISKWFYSRFAFNDTFKLHLFQGWNLMFLTLLLSIFLFAGASVLYPCLWGTPINLIVFSIIGLIGCLIIAMHFIVNIRSSKCIKRVDDFFVLKKYQRDLSKSLKILLFFLISGVFFVVGELCQTYAIVTKMSLLAIIPIIGYWLNSYFIDNIHLMLPRLVASITTAWIMLVIGNDLFKERLSYPLCLIIVGIVYIFLLYENSKTLHNMGTKIIVGRAFELMIISFSISLIVGIFAIDILGNAVSIENMENNLQQPISYDWHLFGNWKNLILTIYPTYLIPFSLLAMFIGVFIQMIFEEKNIMEL